MKINWTSSFGKIRSVNSKPFPGAGWGGRTELAAAAWPHWLMCHGLAEPSPRGSLPWGPGALGGDAVAIGVGHV